MYNELKKMMRDFKKFRSLLDRDIKKLEKEGGNFFCFQTALRNDGEKVYWRIAVFKDPVFVESVQIQIDEELSQSDFYELSENIFEMHVKERKASFSKINETRH